VGFDPFLYVAFAAGYVVGRVVRVRSPWVPRATLATVGVLVGLLGASLDSISGTTLLDSIPIALAFVGAIVSLTIVVALLLAGRAGAAGSSSPAPPVGRRFDVSLVLLAALGFGVAAGKLSALPSVELIPYVLYVLLALVGFDIVLTRSGLKGLWVPLLAAFTGALGAAAVLIAVAGVTIPAALATALGFGFYSLTGPLVAARLGAALGLIAFLTNFLREQLTMLLAPVLGARLRGAGLSALGGATAMDTTLYFVTRYGDRDAASLALATGVALTLAASLLVPAVLAFPW
jgi:uncharacterized membrane protein YbjE (DUF340 family)